VGYLPGCSPSQLLHTRSLAEYEKLEKVLDFIATTENFSVINNWEENSLYPSRNQDKYRKQKPQLTQRESAILLSSMKVTSPIFLASLPPGALTKQPSLAYLSSPILSWALPGLPPSRAHRLPAVTLPSEWLGKRASSRFEPSSLCPAHASSSGSRGRALHASGNCPCARRTSRAPLCSLAFGADQQHPWPHA